MDPLLLRVAEAAQACGIGKSTAYELIASGEMPAIRVGKSLRVPVADLRRWIDSQRDRVDAAKAEAR